MTLETPTVGISGWIAAQLAAQAATEDSALDGVGVYVAAASDDVPRPRKNASEPYITLRYLEGRDQLYLGARLAGTWVTYEVTAWDEGTDVSRLAPLMAEAHQALHGACGAADDLYVTGCSRLAPVERQIPEEDRLYTQLGGEYRIRASAA